MTKTEYNRNNIKLPFRALLIAGARLPAWILHIMVFIISFMCQPKSVEW